MIIGTAGHIDHGKTTLVRALTGVDTDRLEEEKARGISIELGYAYVPLANGEVLGFVDVPGHERLVHTMLAGACGIDFALLVIAADDGVMPQTREHVAILALLGIAKGAVALTKADSVGAARVREVERQARTLLAASQLRDAPVFAVDATAADDPGVDTLREYLHASALRTAARPAEGLFRLAVDRVFTLPGHGTVATGTVFSGRVSTGDTVLVMPGGHPVRVRSIHAQQRAAPRGCAGERCALNITGADRQTLARGDWLADPRALSASLRLDARLGLLAESGATLRAWSPVHVHLGTAHRLAHAVPLESTALGPTSPERVQLVFDVPFCAAAGDRFIVRDAQGRRTIGGGRVLDPAGAERRRRSPQRLTWLGAIEHLLSGGGLAPLLGCAPYGTRMSDLVRLCGCEPARISLPSPIRVVEAAGEQFLVLPERWQTLRAGVLDALRRLHGEAPDEPGLDAGRLRRISFPAMPPALWRSLLGELIADGSVCASGPWLHLPGHRPRLSAEDEQLLARLQPLIAAGGFDPPWVRELAAAVGEPEARVRTVLRKQLAQGGVYQVVRDLFYDPSRVAELAQIVESCACAEGVSTAHFRDAVGLGRKRAIQILEFFDRAGFTRRVRDTRVLRPESAWHAPLASDGRSDPAAGSAA
ncbi:MAG: selenocysteine-specific translation elongation factor [Gammaproteobacteria bacterium]|nr:selenocysteine-specific translation elongation factor [Gammaproteobacteria bacterium]